MITANDAEARKMKRKLEKLALFHSPDYPAYRKEQRESERKMMFARAIPDEANRSGMMVQMAEGSEYEIKEDGSWRRIRKDEKEKSKEGPSDQSRQ